MKNKRGITLIALIITIIVLLILAGVSISIVVGDNGVLNQAQSAKLKTDEASAKEAVEMVMAGFQAEYASTIVENVNSDIADIYIVSDLESELNKVGYKMLYKPTTVTSIFGKIDDEDNEIKEDGTKFKTSIGLNKAGDNNKYIMELTKKSQGVVELTKFEIGDAENFLIKPPVRLYEVAEIGDYVDIGINYTNQGTYYGNQSDSNGRYACSDTALTGWRVLSIDETTGIIKLVSAGRPLIFYHTSGQSDTSITKLGNLNEITMVDDNTQGFTAQGFIASSDVPADKKINLKNIFEKVSPYVDISTTNPIQSITTEEVVTAFNALNKTNYSTEPSTELSNANNINDLLYWYNSSGIGYNRYILRSSEMGLTATDKSIDLLGNGYGYWLGGSFYNSDYLWYVNNSGYVYINDDTPSGVRPVVSLYPDVKVTNEDTPNVGSSSSLAYTISR